MRRSYESIGSRDETSGKSTKTSKPWTFHCRSLIGPVPLLDVPLLEQGRARRPFRLTLSTKDQTHVQLLAHHFCFRLVLLQCHSMLPAWLTAENNSESEVIAVLELVVL